MPDIRRFPGSRKFPQFDSDHLRQFLQENGIQYTHLAGLGGRRKANKETKNNRRRNASFRGYADYMETEDFANAIKEPEVTASKQRTAIMCAEAVWWRCHRSPVSDWLKARGRTVLHIAAEGKAVEHPYTSAARVAGGHVYYFDADLFD